MKPTEANVCYMEKVEVPQQDNPGWFKLNKRIEVAFRPADAKAVSAKQESDGPNREVLQAHLASTMLPEKWRTPCTEVAWIMRWVQKGLQPVRPTVALTVAIEAGPGKSMELTTATA